MAGLAGAAAMALMMMMASAARSLGPLAPLEWIGAVATAGRLDGAAAVLAGVAVHTAIASVAGLAFGVLIGRWVQAPSFDAMLGIVFGIAVFAPATYLVIPRFDAVAEQGALHSGVLFVAHVVFGLVLGLAFGALDRGARAGRPRSGRTAA
jgi:hypothetical protein